jgi:predicted ribosome quality control (RQC) complex YloA/Tae2 family protein
MNEIVLKDWNGEDVRIALDPQLDPAANANRLFDAARKRERAADRLPHLIREAEAKRDAIVAVRERIVRDDAPLDAAAPYLPARVTLDAPAIVRPALPYRRYRTTGGLEVRVGRGARANDELTLRHASPDDIWMHAQGVAGAHVVLRWGRRDENPPAGEIAQAAVLAALHSRARTSGTVAIDWTRRKYVRKPRKAPPGQVMVERTKTVFVEPDPAVEESMRWD